MRGKPSTMLYGTVLLTASGIFGQALGFFYRIALSRMIGAELMGLYQLIMPVYSVLTSITATGLTVACSTLSAKYDTQRGRAAVSQVRRQCLGIFILLLLPAAVVTVIFSDPISVYILGDARTRLGLVLLLPCVLLTGVENLQKHCFFGVGRVRPPAFAEMAEQVVRAVAVLGLLLVFLPQNGEKTVGLIVLGMVACEVFSASTLTVLFRRYLGSRERGTLGAKSLRREIIKIAVPVSGASLLGNLMGSANAILIPQRLVVGGATVSEAMSAFGVISGMTLPMLFLPSAFIGALGLILTPKLAQTSALGQKKALREQLGRVVMSTSALIMPAMALLVVIGPTLGTLLFREPTAGEHILPLAVGVLFCCYQAVLGSSLNGVGKQGLAARNMLISDAVQLAFTFFLVGNPKIGLAGYATGLWVSSLLGAALNYRDICKATGLKGDVFPRMIAPALASVLMGLTARLLFCRLIDLGLGPWWAGLATGCFAVVLYLVALQAQGVRKCDLVGGEKGE